MHAALPDLGRALTKDLATAAPCRKRADTSGAQVGFFGRLGIAASAADQVRMCTRQRTRRGTAANSAGLQSVLAGHLAPSTGGNPMASRSMPQAALPPQRRDRVVAGLEKEIAAAEATCARWRRLSEELTAAGWQPRREQGMARVAARKLQLLRNSYEALAASRPG
jgi:hypothetical protein